MYTVVLICASLHWLNYNDFIAGNNCYNFLIMKIFSILPSPRGKWMNHRSRLASLGNSSTTPGSSDPGRTVGPSYSYVVETFFRTRCSSFHFHSSYIFPLSLSYFILAVPMHKCFGEHSSTDMLHSCTRAFVHEFHISYSHTEWSFPFLGPSLSKAKL